MTPPKGDAPVSDPRVMALVEALEAVCEETKYVDNSYARAAHRIATKALASFKESPSHE